MKEFFRLRIRIWGLLTAAGFLGTIGSISGFFGQYAWWLDIGSHFRIQYTFIFLVLTLCYLSGKKWKWALACFAVVIINAAPVVAFLLPPRSYDTINGTALKAVLINVNTQYGNPKKVVQFLQKENPDIVVLEEINDDWMKHLASVLQTYPVQLVQSRTDNFGMALLARTETISTQLVYFGFGEIPSIIAKMQSESGSFTLIATHPLPPGGEEYSQYRNEQLNDVAEYVHTNSSRLILLGDLNVSPWSHYYRKFIDKSGLINSSKGRAIHPTWPTFSPLFLIPIDHCLHTTGIAIKSKKIGPGLGSDHYPVIIEFSVKE